MKTCGLAVAVLAVALAFSAQAADPKESAGSNAGNLGDQIVCFADPATGSHIKRRVCMSQAERERRRQADHEALTKLRSRGGPRSNRDP